MEGDDDACLAARASCSSCAVFRPAEASGIVARSLMAPTSSPSTCTTEANPGSGTRRPNSTGPVNGQSHGDVRSRRCVGQLVVVLMANKQRRNIEMARDSLKSRVVLLSKYVQEFANTLRWCQ